MKDHDKVKDLKPDTPCPDCGAPLLPGKFAPVCTACGLGFGYTPA